MFRGASDRFPQSRHQLGLFNVFGFEHLGLVLSEQQRAQRGLPAQTLSPNHLEEEGEEEQEVHVTLELNLQTETPGSVQS